MINGNAYKLNVNDVNSLQKVPEIESKQLINLLEALNNQQQIQHKKIESAVSRENRSQDIVTDVYEKPGRMNEGDIDALMKKLIVEEQKNKKPSLSKKSICKKILIAIAIVIAIIIVF